MANRIFEALRLTPDGLELDDLMHEPDSILRMKVAADLGLPAVRGLEAPLIERHLRLAREVRSSDQLRQLAGYICYELLRDKYELGPDSRQAGPVVRGGRKMKRKIALPAL